MRSIRRLRKPSRRAQLSLQHHLLPRDGIIFVALAAHCQRDKVEQERLVEQERIKDLESTGREMGLTKQQIGQAKAEGVTLVLGLRRIEANTLGRTRFPRRSLMPTVTRFRPSPLPPRCRKAGRDCSGTTVRDGTTLAFVRSVKPKKIKRRNPNRRRHATSDVDEFPDSSTR